MIKKDDIIADVKSIANWYGHNKGKTLDDLTEEVSSSVSGSRGPKANPLRYDKKFIEI